MNMLRQSLLVAAIFTPMWASAGDADPSPPVNPEPFAALLNERFHRPVPPRENPW